MNWLRLLQAGLAALLLVGGNARADCAGTNLFDTLADENPTAYAEIHSRAAKTPNGEGNFWRVERDGVAPSHILGTFHSPEVVPMIPDHVWRVLDQADALALEYPFRDVEAFSQKMLADPSVMYDEDQPPLDESLSPEQFDLLLKVLFDRGFAYFEIDGLRPWMLFFYLSSAPCEASPGYADLEDLDLVVSNRAARRGIPEFGLEPIERVPSHFDVFTSHQLAAMFVEPESLLDQADNMLWTGAQFYGREQTAVADEWGEWLGRAHGVSPEVEDLWLLLRERLVDRRNLAWMENLEALLEKGNAFIAVGTGHLPGEAGLVRLLRQRGWRLTRIPFAGK